MAIMEIWWLPLATNTTNNGSEWQVWEMYMAITMSTGERTELPPVAEMLHHNGPEFFKPLHVSQIHQIRTNTMLQDCFEAVILVCEFLNTEDYSN